MNREDLIKRIRDEKAPASGMMYALYKGRVIYCPYCMDRTDSDGDGRRIILIEQGDLAENLLELHLFDSEKEYRLVLRRGLDPVSKLIDDSCMEPGGFKYIEKQINTLDLDHTGHTEPVNIVNYVSFAEDDLLQIENYRLMEVR